MKLTFCMIDESSSGLSARLSSLAIKSDRNKVAIKSNETSLKGNSLRWACTCHCTRSLTRELPTSIIGTVTISDARRTISAAVVNSLRITSERYLWTSSWRKENKR